MTTEAEMFRRGDSSDPWPPADGMASTDDAIIPAAGEEGPADAVRAEPVGAPVAKPSQGLNRRRDMQRRVRFECDMHAVPLPFEVAPMGYTRAIKPWLDAVLAALALIVLSPILLLVALAIKLHDGGPVMFVQNRTGYLGKQFRLYKFRTMVLNATELKHQLMDQNIHGPQSPDFKVANDPRITGIGRFLRKTSLDELPNLINIVRGEMAIVGPRPTSFDAGTYAMHHLPRLAVRPGLTGLWQTSGRANVDFDERCDLDIHYIRRMSPKFDFALIWRTIRAAWKGDGAM